MGNSTTRRRPRHHQSAKPYPDFALTAHPSGRWCKKVLGKVLFFGKIDDPQAALDKWNAEKEDLYAGRIPREKLPEGITLRDLVIAYLRQQKASMDNAELSPRTFQDNHRTCANLIEHFGKTRLLDDMRQDDFAAYRVAMAKRFGPVSLGNAIQRVRSVFKFALESGMVKTQILFGPGFKRPSKKTLRLERAKKGPKLFTREELHKFLDAAGIPMKAMILLACNAGLGNSDLANMPLAAVDLETGWVDFPRPKTGIARRFPLWPETIAALRNVIAKRPTPKMQEDAGLLFITKHGAKWSKAIFEQRQPEPGAEPAADETSKTYRVNNDSAIAKEFVKLFAEVKIERKKGRSFYTIRHIFETVAGESRDQVAVDHVMGHARDDMASIYRERISDERLKAVTDHVRTWLFPSKESAKPEAHEPKQQA